MPKRGADISARRAALAERMEWRGTGGFGEYYWLVGRRAVESDLGGIFGCGGDDFRAVGGGSLAHGRFLQVQSHVSVKRQAEDAVRLPLCTGPCASYSVLLELPRQRPREPYQSRFFPAIVHGAGVAPTSDPSRVPALLPRSRRPSRHRCFPATGGHRNRAGLTDSAAGPAYFTMPPDRSHPHLKSLYLGVSCLNFYSGPIDSQWEAAPLEAAELLGCRLAGV